MTICLNTLDLDLGSLNPNRPGLFRRRKAPGGGRNRPIGLFSTYANFRITPILSTFYSNSTLTALKSALKLEIFSIKNLWTAFWPAWSRVRVKVTSHFLKFENVEKTNSSTSQALSKVMACDDWGRWNQCQNIVKTKLLIQGKFEGVFCRFFF